MASLLPSFDRLEKIDNDYPDPRIFPEEKLFSNEYWNDVPRPKTGNWHKYEDKRVRYGYGSEEWDICMWCPIDEILQSLTPKLDDKIIVTQFVLNMKTRRIQNETCCSLTNKYFESPNQVTVTAREIYNAIRTYLRRWNDARFWSYNKEKRVYQILVQHMKSKEEPDPPVLRYIWEFSKA